MPVRLLQKVARGTTAHGGLGGCENHATRGWGGALEGSWGAAAAISMYVMVAFLQVEGKGAAPDSLSSRRPAAGGGSVMTSPLPALLGGGDRFAPSDDGPLDGGHSRTRQSPAKAGQADCAQ